MIAFYKIKCDHICSIPNKKLTKKKSKHQSHSLCSTSFTLNSVSIPILISSGTSDLVIILISFICKCGLLISMNLLLAQ